MEQEDVENEVIFLCSCTRVTKLSKYFALILFIFLPFLGGWIGYVQAPVKIVEEEKIVYVNKESGNIINNTDLKEENVASAEATTSQKEKIIHYSAYPYLSEEAKEVVESYRSHIISSMDAEFLDIYASDYELERFALSYFDDDKALISISSIKGRTGFSLLARDTWELIATDDGCLSEWNGYIETADYIIGVSDRCGVAYYKRGDSVFRTISDTELPSFYDTNQDDFAKFPIKTQEEILEINKKAILLNPNNETYVEDYGFADYYDVSFDEVTRVLTASVFKKGVVGSNIKTREITFKIAD